MYFRTYFTAIPASSYLLVGNLNDFRTSVVDSIRPADGILILISLAGYLIKIRHRENHKAAFMPYAVSAVVLLAICAVSTIPYKGMNSHIRFLTQQCYYTNCPPAVYTVFGKIISDAMTANETLSDGDKVFISNYLRGGVKPLVEICDTSRVKRDKIIFIFLESLESWTLDNSIEGKEITPNLNRYVADSTTFYAPNVLTQVGNGRSIDAQLLNIAGLLPMLNEVYAMTRSDNTFHTLPKAVKEANPPAKAYLLTGDKGTVWNQSRVASAFGIDTILDARHWKITDKIGNPPKLSDEALFTQIVEKCKSGEILPQDQHAFVQIIAYSSHNPFVIPEDKRSIILNGEYPDKFADYITAVNYVDRSLDILISYLESRPDWKSTSVVIVGDHEGLAVYRDNMLNHPNTANMVDSMQHTPFIVLNAPVPGRYDGTMGQVDVYTTLLDMMNLQSYRWKGLGFSVLNPDFPAAAIDSKGAIVADDAKKLTPEMRKHLRDSRKASDLILRFNLL